MKLSDYREKYNDLKLKKNLEGIEALEAVKKNGYALQFVQNQTEEICLEAVKKNGYALQYVQNQTEAICLEAVKQGLHALKYIESSFFKETEEEKLIREFKELEQKLKTKGLI